MIVFDVLICSSLWVTRAIRCACSLRMPVIRNSWTARNGARSNLKTMQRSQAGTFTMTAGTALCNAITEERRL